MISIQTTKTIASTVVGLSVSYVTGQIIANNIDPEKPHQKVEAFVGGAAIGWMVRDHTESWTNAKIDSIDNWFKKMKNKDKTDA